MRSVEGDEVRLVEADSLNQKKRPKGGNTAFASREEGRKKKKLGVRGGEAGKDTVTRLFV